MKRRELIDHLADTFNGVPFWETHCAMIELMGLIRCHLGYHVWPGEPWDHCIRCYATYPD